MLATMQEDDVASKRHDNNNFPLIIILTERARTATEIHHVISCKCCANISSECFALQQNVYSQHVIKLL